MEVTINAVTAWVDPQRPVTGPPIDWTQIDTFVVHYTAANNLIDGDPGENWAGIPQYLRSIQLDYLTNRPQYNSAGVKTASGYSIGYHFAIDQRGVVWTLRGWDIRSAANVDHNQRTFTVLFLVDGNDEATPAAVAAAKYLLAEAVRRARRKLVVTGHGLLSGAQTSCPGAGLLRQIRGGIFSEITVNPFVPSTDAYVHRLDGFDGSHWQKDAGPVDFAALRRSTWWFAWKATQSIRGADPTFTWARNNVAPLGFRHRFFYHWLSSTTDVAAQADHYLRTVGTLAVGEGVMLDAEETGITEASCLAWLERVEAVIQRPSSVYTGLYVAGGTIWKSAKIRNSNFGPRPMHLAAYCTRERLLELLKSTDTTALPIHAWQYSSNGPVPGITGRADMNTIIDPAIFDRSCGIVESPAPAPAPIPIPVPPPQDDEDMATIITNNEQRLEAAPKVEKYVLMPNGKLRHLPLVEWQLLGQKEGVPLDNWVLDTVLGWWKPEDGESAPCPPCPDCPPCPPVSIPTTITLQGKLS